MWWTLALAHAADPVAAHLRDTLTETEPFPPCVATHRAVPSAVPDARASSELVEGSLVHAATRAIDGDPATAWVEGAKGVGHGESLRLRVPTGAFPAGMLVTPGYAKDAARWQKNHRVAEVSVRWLKAPEGVDPDTAWASDQLVPTTTEALQARFATDGGQLPVGKAQTIDFDGVWHQNMEQTEVVAVDLVIVSTEGEGAQYDDTVISEVQWLSRGERRSYVCDPGWCDAQKRTPAGCESAP
jgi:hypothetical protein